MSEDSVNKIVEEVGTMIERSHQGAAKSISAFGADLQAVKRYQEIQNGRTAKHTEQIASLEQTIIESTSKVRGALWAFAITGGVVVALIASIYWITTNNLTDRIDNMNSNLSANIDKVSDQLYQHITK